MLSAFLITSSKLPYSLSHLAAVFSPTFVIPGMLSDLSPTRASNSATLFGKTPNFSLTPFSSKKISLIELC